MANDFFTVTVSPKIPIALQRLRYVRRAVGEQTRIPMMELRKIASMARKQILERVSRGQSPIKGRGRFPGYKNPDRYPGNRKAKRPVNLKLTGDFYRALRADVRRYGTETAIQIGFADEKNALKEEGHRKGTNGQLIRPIIPLENKEEFEPRIVRALKREYIRQYKAQLRRRGFQVL